ncbi:MAG: hypothetical protein PHV71_00415 [Eubacteriales bacterium]|nr:hypothetical protein [Eubacteriales bacterium]MDD3198705.1 hypothetical protein [Eubacteriales bacterium]MDD4121877.1 hypothetical protein [Eubacteriales bacterium]MDD4629049.1 hypothetical protein [Eubacteriales bacterium]
MSYYYLIGIRMDNRTGNAVQLQDTLTKNGCKIKTRLGMHDTSENACANDGILILQPFGEQEEVEQLVKDLNNLEGVTAKLIDLN